MCKKDSFNSLNSPTFKTAFAEYMPKKKGKLFISHRYNQTPLLYSYPGGFNGSWSYKTCPISLRFTELFYFPASFTICKDTNKIEN